MAIIVQCSKRGLEAKSIRFPPVLIDALDRASKDMGCSRNSVVVEAIASFLELEYGPLRSMVFRLPEPEAEMFWNHPRIVDGQVTGDLSFISQWLLDELDRGMPSIVQGASGKYFDVPLTQEAIERLRSLPHRRLCGLLRNVVRTKCVQNTDDLS